MEQANKPRTQDSLHGITLKQIVTQLVETYGWDELGRLINIKCFTNDPSISSSLKFLRKTPWARQKVEALYLHK
ncbi:MAG: transporter [Gammaproteobacteria bacterium]|nr:MAG: transporter [Gammaproteobacteria bacterium]